VKLYRVKNEVTLTADSFFRCRWGFHKWAKWRLIDWREPFTSGLSCEYWEIFCICKRCGKRIEDIDNISGAAEALIECLEGRQFDLGEKT